jgi:phosphate transport system protein
LRHFEIALDELRTSLLDMSQLVESSIQSSVSAVLRQDLTFSEQTFTNEARINRLQIEIDDRATRLLALEQPVARDLRFITSAIKINNDLERMGDEAVNIAQRADPLARQAPLLTSIDIARLAQLTQSMVHNALEAFVTRLPDLARNVLASDDSVDDAQEAIDQQLLARMQTDPTTIPPCVNLMFIAHSLERIADHATNIAEDVLFLVRGVDVRHHSEAGTQ